MTTNEFLKSKLKLREESGALRVLRSDDGLIDFCSNDYLGLAGQEFNTDNHLSDLSRINGSTGSRLIRGNSEKAEELELFIAAYHSAGSALLFNSGYVANLGIFSAVPQRNDTVLYDELAHASIRDGIRLSNARSFSFRHNNLEDLIRKSASATGNVFVAVESIYSMDGDEAPLKELSELCGEKGWNLIVDEAHSAGIFGEDGSGLCVESGISANCFARIITYGKAFGCHGAAVVGSPALRNFLINFSRPFIYTTALPPAALDAISDSYSFMQNAVSRRMELETRINSFNQWKVSVPELHFIKSRSAIHSLIIPGNQNVKAASEFLKKEGLDVRPVMSPTVPEGLERLRICLHSFNTWEEMELLWMKIRQWSAVNPTVERVN